MDQAQEEWAWEHTYHSNAAQEHAWKRYTYQLLARRRWDVEEPRVIWEGSINQGLGPWVGDGVYYFHSAEHWASQWYPSVFTSSHGVVYTCAEQFIMHQKALLFGDEAAAAQIMAATEPWQQKQLGKRVRGFDDQVWDRERRELVYLGNTFKFSQHAAMRRELLQTEGLVLAEASERDSIWGIGMNESDARRLPVGQALMNGENLLGEALMRVRQDMLCWEVQYAEGGRSGGGGGGGGGSGGGGGNGSCKYERERRIIREQEGHWGRNISRKDAAATARMHGKWDRAVRMRYGLEPKVVPIASDGSNVVTLEPDTDLVQGDLAKVVGECAKRRANNLWSPFGHSVCLYNGNIFTNRCPRGAKCPAAASHEQPATVTPAQRARFLDDAKVYVRVSHVPRG